MKRIFVGGLTSTLPGSMEHHNLGNYAIIEPFIYYMKKEFPDFDINTSIQMSDEFCKKHDITSLRHKRFWTYGKLTAFETIKDIMLVIVWRTIRTLFKKDAQGLFNKSPFLSELNRSLILIDFSGDIFGDNAGWRPYMEDCAEIAIAKIMGKPVVMLMGSPGPFKNMWRRVLARLVLKKIDLITNREPRSTELLRKYEIFNSNIHSTACTAFLFEGPCKDEVEEIIEKEKLDFKDDRPLIGLIICGWNMPVAPFNKLPRDEWELKPFVELIQYVVKTLNARVVLMSHQNRTDDQGNLISGNDHAIIDQLYNLIEDKAIKQHVLKLKYLYDARDSKGIIGLFDMLISGRIHGAVSGLSQCIPTVIIDYGHEPKAHKLEGFALNAGVAKYLANPLDALDMIEKTAEAWENRHEIHTMLLNRIPEVQELALLNIKLLRPYLDNKAY